MEGPRATLQRGLAAHAVVSEDELLIPCDEDVLGLDVTVAEETFMQSEYGDCQLAQQFHDLLPLLFWLELLETRLLHPDLEAQFRAELSDQHFVISLPLISTTSLSSRRCLVFLNYNGFLLSGIFIYLLSWCCVL